MTATQFCDDFEGTMLNSRWLMTVGITGPVMVYQGAAAVPPDAGAARREWDSSGMTVAPEQSAEAAFSAVWRSNGSTATGQVYVRRSASNGVYALHWNDFDPCGPGCLGKWELKYDGTFGVPGCRLKEYVVLDAGAGSMSCARGAAIGDRLKLTVVTEADPADGGVKDHLRAYLNGQKILELYYDGDERIGIAKFGGPCTPGAYPMLTGAGIGFAVAPGTVSPVPRPVFEYFKGAYGAGVQP